jgi:hypothetical protein
VNLYPVHLFSFQLPQLDSLLTSTFCRFPYGNDCVRREVTQPHQNPKTSQGKKGKKECWASLNRTPSRKNPQCVSEIFITGPTVRQPERSQWKSQRKSKVSKSNILLFNFIIRPAVDHQPPSTHSIFSPQRKHTIGSFELLISALIPSLKSITLTWV